MSPLNIIIPVVVVVVIIICGIVLFFLRKCIRWRIVSLVNPKRRTMSDESIIQNNAHTLASVDGHYQTLGSLPVLDTEQISSGKSVAGNNIPEGPSTSEFNRGRNSFRNSFRKSFKGKIAQMTSMSQEIILSKTQMGVYNIPENELKYYKENCLKYKKNGEVNLNFQRSRSEEFLGLGGSYVGHNLTPNSNLRIEKPNETFNSNSRIEEAEEPLSSNSRTMSREHISSNSRTMSRERISPNSRTMSRERISPNPRTMSREYISPNSRTMSREHISPNSRTLSREHISPNSRTMSREHISPNSRTMSREHISSNSRAMSREHISSNSRTMSREHISSNSRTMSREPLSSEARQKIENCLKNKIAETSLIQQEEATTTATVSEEIKK